jgi:hypothetical protein
MNVSNQYVRPLYSDWTEKELHTRAVRFRPVSDVDNHGGHGGGHARDRAVHITWHITVLSHARSDRCRIRSRASDAGPDSEMRKDSSTASGSEPSRSLNGYLSLAGHSPITILSARPAGGNLKFAGPWFRVSESTCPGPRLGGRARPGPWRSSRSHHREAVVPARRAAQRRRRLGPAGGPVLRAAETPSPCRTPQQPEETRRPRARPASRPPHACFRVAPAGPGWTLSPPPGVAPGAAASEGLPSCGGGDTASSPFLPFSGPPAPGPPPTPASPLQARLSYHMQQRR